jgi:anthranilate phosphoribosyltransferase
VFSEHWVRPVAEVLGTLGSRRVMVVHSSDGLDEISIGGVTHVAELRDGEVHDYRIEPEQFGMDRATLDAVRVATAAESLEMIRGVYAGRPGPAADIVALNAGAAIYVAGLAESHGEGVERARALLADGSTARKLEEFVAATHRFGEGHP